MPDAMNILLENKGKIIKVHTTYKDVYEGIFLGVDVYGNVLLKEYFVNIPNEQKNIGNLHKKEILLNGIHVNYVEY